jgi:hypothetical protein
MMRKLSLWLLCVSCLLSTALLYGQGTSGASSVTGRVTDSSGAVIGGADVTLTDLTTNIPITTQSNPAGLYIFNNIVAGKYSVTVSKAGFSKAEVKDQAVLVGQATTVNITLEVGQISEVVEVKTVAGAELETLNATMGQTITNEGMMELPFINRDAAGLLFLQPTVAPTFHGAEGNITSGQVAGNMSDQNSYLLDGGNATSSFDGDNGTYVGARSGVVPTPMESIEEVRVNTNNNTADYGLSGGGQILMNTKRGTNQFHGSAYDFFQSDVLSANDWFNNFTDSGKPKSHYNKFGGAFGGPIGPSFWGGKTYFFANYEGERYPRSGPYERTVPSNLFREGIIQERDANGNVVQYNLATSMACGATGGQPCDPRGLGLSPTVNALWNKYMPQCNTYVGAGDGLNTCGYLSNLSYPLGNDFGVVRVDHDFGAKWRFFASYRYFRETNPTTNQVDIGGLLPGDTLGTPASASNFPLGPRYLVTGITGTLTPNLTNEGHISYTRDQWQYLRAGAEPQLPGLNGALEIGGESSQALIPINVDTQDARNRLWDGHQFDYRDTLSWLKGTHLFQFGGEFVHDHWHFDRYDNVVGGLTQLVEDVNNTGVNFTPAFQPIPCTTSVVTNCLPAGQIGNWNQAYSELAGIVDETSVVATRSGANLTANPPGTPLRSFVTDQTYSLFMNDSWKVKPNITISYGLNWITQMPPIDENGAQDVLTNATGQVVTINQYLANVERAAGNGQVYNPTLGFTPVQDISPGNKYPYHPFYGGFGPRASIAWNPEVKDGWLGKLLGDKATVFRAGYGRYFSRSLAAGLISTSVLGDGFLQPVGCQNPNSAGVCTGTGQVTPANAFRIGVDGTNAPVGAITPTLTIPVTPGVNAPYATLVSSLDQNWRPARTDQIDISIQRQLKGNMILEVGYVGTYAANLYQGIDFGNVPYMTKLGGQTFAQAYQNMYYALAAGKNPAPQPFLETALKGSSFCSGYSSCTAAVAATQSGQILTQSVTNLWSDLDTSWTAFGPALTSSTQCFYCYAYTSDGYSNYNAMVVTLQKRYSAGLTVNANFTWSHALGIISTNQAYTLDNAGNPFNLNSDYGPQYFDRRYSFNLLSSYQLPFGKGKRWGNNANPVLSRIISGWTVSPILSAASGVPINFGTGSYQEQGQAFDGDLSAEAIPTSGNSNLSHSPQFGVNATGTVAVGGNPANGGSGANFFSNPTAVFNNFRPFILGVDGRTGGAGTVYGQTRYNLDLGITKDTRFNERIGAQLFVQAFNVTNHMEFTDPSLNLQNPYYFGVLGPTNATQGQYNALTLGGAGASANYTRIIQIGLRVSF